MKRDNTKRLLKLFVVVGLGMVTAMVIVYADASIDTMFSSVGKVIGAIYEQIKYIVPFAAALAIAILILMFILTNDEKKTDAYKRKMFAIIIACVVIGAIPIILNVAASLSSTVNAGETLAP